MHRRLIALTAHSRLPFSIGILAGVLAGLCGLAQAYALSAAVDGAFLRHQTLAGVWPWLRILLVVISARALLLWLQEVASNEIAVRIKHDLRQRLFQHLLALGPGFTRRERSGELTAAAAEGIEALDAYYSQYLPQLIVGLLVPLVFLLFVLRVDLLSGLILLLTAPLIPLFMYLVGRTAEIATQRQYQTLGRLASHFLDSLQGLTTLKIFGQSVAQAANISWVADEFRSATQKVLQVSFLSAFALELVATISTAIIAVEVGLRLLYGQMLFGQALFLLVLTPEFFAPLRLLGARFHAGMAGTVAARRIFQILDTPAPAAPQACVSKPGRSALSPSSSARPALMLRHVTYAYPGSSIPAVRDVDLVLKSGEHVALVGPSGSGKSTLASLLLGFMLPSAGQIQLGDRPLNDLSVEDRRRLIAWVPQKPHLFHDSLAANIRLGKPDASDDDVAQAAQLAHLSEFIATLPQQYSTPIGEAGARLSSGEAQRLALARALLMDASIVILDEPTSSLDPQTEARLDESIRRLAAGRTLITIAHRLNTIVQADRILVLAGGRIVEQGTHAALLARRGMYASLVSATAAGGGSLATDDRPSPPASAAAGDRFRLPIGPWIPSVLQPSEAPRGVGRTVWPQLLGFLRGSWGWMLLSVLLASLTVGSSVGLMGTSAWLISSAALHPSIAALQLAIVGVRFFGIARAAFRYCERLISHNVTFRLLRAIRVWFYAKLEPLAPARLMDFRAGDLVARAMADVETLENLFVRVLAPPMSALCVVTGTCLILTLNGASDVAAMLAVFSVLAGIVLPLSAAHFTRRSGTAMVVTRGELHALMVDGIQGIADLLAFGRGDHQLERIDAVGAAHAAAERYGARVSGLHAALLTLLGNLALWMTLVILTPRVQAGNFNGLMLAAVALMVLAAFEALSPILQAAHLWPATQAAAERLVELVDVPPAVTDTDLAHSRRASASEDLADPPRLEVTNLSFSYPGRSQPALRDMSFVVESGQAVGIVGPSGAGKSTIAHLLLRFWDYDAGHILLSGRSLRDFSPDLVRARVGHVSQPAYFFDTSIYENLRLARRGASRAQVEMAARRALAHEFILGLPHGYDTLIGEHGARLSAGELQRLALARLILRDAPLLLMDEPTANLDAVTEMAILESLFDLMRGKTSLMITHRLIGMEHLDRIIVLDHGQIVENGSHSSLLAAGGLYASLWSIQNPPPDPAAVTLAGAA